MLKEDIRSSQSAKDTWIMEGDISDTMAAYISFSKDKSDYIYSVYVKHQGLSFGYFFRSGGSINAIEEAIAECMVEGKNKRAFISMNRQRAERLEMDDNNSIQVIDIDSDKTFAIVLPADSGAITYDREWNSLMYDKWKEKMVESIRKAFAGDETLAGYITSDLKFLLFGYKVKFKWKYLLHTRRPCHY